MQKQQNKKKGTLGVVSQATPKIPASTYRPLKWRMTVIADARDENGKPTATEIAQFMTLPGIALARVAITRYLEDAQPHNNTKVTHSKISKLPISA